jgi:hypothetical protein
VADESFHESTPVIDGAYSLFGTLLVPYHISLLIGRGRKKGD